MPDKSYTVLIVDDSSVNRSYLHNTCGKGAVKTIRHSGVQDGRNPYVYGEHPGANGLYRQLPYRCSSSAEQTFIKGRIYLRRASANRLHTG